jgi:hypothetical protein
MYCVFVLQMLSSFKPNVFYYTKKTGIKCPGLYRRQIFLTIFARTGIWTLL